MLEIIRMILLGIFLLIEGIRDLKRHKISMVSVILFAIIGIVLIIPEVSSVWGEVAAGLMVGFSIMILSKITGGKIGYGDGCIMIISGLYLGFYGNLILFMIALFLSAIASIVLLICRKANKKTELPFVSFLFAGFIMMLIVFV